MTNPLKALVLLAGFTMAIVSARAQIVYVQYSGTGTAAATGSVDGVAYSDQDWMLEIGVDTSVADGETENPNYGSFADAIVSGALRIGSVTYLLTHGAAAGNVSMIYDGGTNYGSVGFNPSNGGYGEFRGAATAVVPAVFSDPNDLGSLHVGVSLANTVPEGTGNNAEFRFDYSPNPEDDYDQRLRTEDGHAIQLSARSTPGSGTLTLSVSSTSFTATPVPEPATTAALMAGAAGLVAMIVRRRRAR